MKIAFTASGPNLSDPIDPRFGRSPYYIFIDPDTMEFEALENPNLASPSGAGIQAAQFIADQGATALLTGSCGPNAFQTLQAAGVDVIVGVSGTIKDAVEQYKSGRFQKTPQANVPSHFGMEGSGAMNPGFGSGMGRGMGGGMGRGMGRGIGRGMGRGMGYDPTSEVPFASSPAIPPPSPEESINSLKQQAELLKRQLAELNSRIDELEKNKE
jgi:predicted Fe-Mo cluster-binding NifX family protein